MGIEADLVELEKRFWEAPGDASVYREKMVEDGWVLMPPPAGMMGRDRTADAVESSPPWVTYELHDINCVELGSDAAVLTYRAVASREDRSEPYEALISSTYRNDNGEWKLVTHQQTPQHDD